MTGVIARPDNVVDVDFCSAAPPPAAEQSNPWRPDPAGEELPAARPVPARWSPRPVRVLRRRFLRSELAADLRQWAWLVGLMTAAVVLLVAGDHLHALITGGSL